MTTTTTDRAAVEYVTTHGERADDMHEARMAGAGHMADALASGLTVSAAWEYVRDMSQMSQRWAVTLGKSYAGMKEERQAIRVKHGVTDWGLGTTGRHADRKLG